jgi:hypothetical protein
MDWVKLNQYFYGLAQVRDGESSHRFRDSTNWAGPEARIFAVFFGFGGYLISSTSWRNSWANFSDSTFQAQHFRLNKV